MDHRQEQSFRPPAEGESLSLACPRESSQREGHPASALSGLPARKVRGRAPGFVDSTSCADAKLACIHASHPAGFPPPARRCRGAPCKATRILRVLFRTARSNAPSPQPSPRLCRGEGAKPSAAHISLFSSSALQLFSSSALQLFSFRRRAAAAHRVRARMARCSTRGPCSAVSWGRQARRGIGRDADAFSSGQDALSKSPAPAHGLAGQDARQAPSGVAFSFGYFSLGHAREK